jgi:uncharacterized phage protein (TIGR01671 family)
MNNRKIKVLVWSKTLEKLLTKDEWFLDFDGNLYFQEWENDNGNRWFNIVSVPEDYYIVQQYTGKFDIEDQEICEGDIVEFVFAVQTNERGVKDARLPKECFGIYEIFYSGFNACFKVRCHKKNWLDGNHTTQKEADKQTIEPLSPVGVNLESDLGRYGICRVIGNIYENPELLK